MECHTIKWSIFQFYFVTGEHFLECKETKHSRRFYSKNVFRVAQGIDNREEKNKAASRTTQEIHWITKLTNENPITRIIFRTQPIKI